MTFAYKARTLFTGFKIGLKNPSLYIGIPTKYFSVSGKVMAGYKGNKVKQFDRVRAVCEQTFNDRFRPGQTYTLAYFLWKRVKKSELKEKKEKMTKKEYKAEVETIAYLEASDQLGEIKGEV